MLITPIDKSKELSGVEATYYGVVLLIARANNTNFKQMFRTLLAPHKYKMDNNQTIPEEISEDLMLQCYSKTILIGWSNMFDAEGKEIPYTTKGAYELMKDDEDAFDFIKNQSNNMDAFMKKDEEITKGK